MPDWFPATAHYVNCVLRWGLVAVILIPILRISHDASNVGSVTQLYTMLFLLKMCRIWLSFWRFAWRSSCVTALNNSQCSITKKKFQTKYKFTVFKQMWREVCHTDIYWYNTIHDRGLRVKCIFNHFVWCTSEMKRHSLSYNEIAISTRYCNVRK